jgi:hypothetical protein
VLNERRTRRRWIVPLLVLAVGGALAYWGVQREARRMQAIEQQVQSICRDIAAGRPVAGTLNAGNPAVERFTIETLRRVVDSPATADGLAVRVVTGDVDRDRGGSAMTQATHTATVLMGDVELLLLRIRCEEPDQPIVVLGFIEP